MPLRIRRCLLPGMWILPTQSSKPDGMIDPYGPMHEWMNIVRYGTTCTKNICTYHVTRQGDGVTMNLHMYHMYTPYICRY